MALDYGHTGETCRGQVPRKVKRLKAALHSDIRLQMICNTMLQYNTNFHLQLMQQRSLSDKGAPVL
jgi:hypothetical protein